MKNLRILLPYFRQHWKMLVLGLLAIAAMAGLGLLGPVVIGWAVDRLRQEPSREVLLTYAGAVLGIALVGGLFSFFQRMILVTLSRNIEFELRGRYLGHLLRLPQGFYHESYTGDLMARASNDMEAVRMMCGPAIMYSANTVFAGTGALLLMASVNLRLTLVALCTLPLVAISTRVFGQFIHRHFKRVQDQFSELSTKVQENFSGARVVRAYAQEDAETEAFRGINREYLDRNQQLIRWQSVFSPLLHLLIGLGFVAVLGYGGVLAYLGTITVGEMIEFQLLLGRLAWPMIALGWVVNLFQRASASMGRIQEVLDAEITIRDQPPLVDAADLEQIRGSVAFKNLSFRYSDDGPQVLSEIDFEAPAGTTVALVGRTGAGKSTLLSLMPRIFEPPEASVFLDGYDVRHLPLATLRGTVAVVPQETFLFSATVAENIAFGRPELRLSDLEEKASRSVREEIEEAARLAGLGEDLELLPQGLDTVVGERGVTLSGGQKQRVALARAIFRSPRLLLLDDCLSAVDTATEETILRNLRRVFEGRTVFLVSHRISTVQGADLILVLEGGRITQRGTHRELASQPGLYADLHQRQRLEDELEAV